MIGRKGTLAAANVLVGTLLGLAAAILVGRYFEPADVGQLTYALGALGLVFFLTDLGMGAAHVKRVSEGRDPGDCFATFAVFKLVSTTVFVLAVALALVVYLVVLGKPLEDTTLPVVVLVVFYYVARSLAEVGQSSFDARLETAKSQLASFSDTLVRVVLTILFALVSAAVVHRVGPLVGRIPDGNPVAEWVRDEPGAALALATTAGGVAAAVVSLSLLFRTLEWGRFRWDLLKDYASFALPLFVANAMGMIATNVDAVVLGFFGGAADPGVFGQVRRLPLVLTAVGTAVGALLFPAISALMAQGDREGVRRVADAAQRYLSMLFVPAVAFAAAFPRELIHLTLGDKWLSGAAALALLTAYVLVFTLGFVHSYLLLGMDRPGVPARIGIVTAVTLIVLDLALVPQDIQSLGLRLAGLGVTGAAIATLVSGIVWYVGVRTATARIVGYRERSHLWWHLLGGAIMAGALLLLDWTVLPLERWYHLPLYMAVGAAVYGGALIAMRELTREDLALARAALHPGEMARYVAGEIRRRRD